MKHWRRILEIFGIILAVSAFGAAVAYAATSEQVVSGNSDHTLYKSGNLVNITGKVNGDIFCAASTVTIDAEVNGDVICAGQTVTVNGRVHGDLRVAGQTVNVGAQIDRNATVAGQDITLQSGAEVGGDSGLFGQTVNVNGRINRDLRAGAATLFINGNIGRDAEVNVNRLDLGRGAVISGNLTYTGPHKLHQAAGGKVDGRTVYHQKTHNRPGLTWRAAAFRFHVYWMLAMLVLAMALVALFPQLFGRWDRLNRQRFWQSLLTGFLAMFIVPALLLTLVVTVFGAPLAFLLLLLWLAALLLSAPIAAFFIGRFIMDGDNRAPLIMLAGIIALGLLSLIPIAGWLITLIAIWFGTGSLLLNLKDRYQKPKYRV
jgi:cytoskeletal protein CcmA (bactofilin family)